MLGRKDFTRDELESARRRVAAELAAYRAVTATADRDTVAGKDGNPLNEVELLVESLLTNDGVLTASTVITLLPERSVLGLKPGDRIELPVDDVDRLAAAFFTELEARFVSEPAD